MNFYAHIKIMYKRIKAKLKGLNFWKTIYANFAYLPWSVAYRFPIFIYGRVELRNVRRGGIVFRTSKIMPGMFRFGAPIMDVQPKSVISVLNIKGTCYIDGNVCIGRGGMIEVANDATLSLGNNTTITGNTTIICAQEIRIGNRCMISWENLIMDSDWHNIIDLNTGNVMPKQKTITIGNHVWIGCRCTILKGTSIHDESIVASNSKISKVFTSKNVIIGSNNILREKVNWG